MYRFVYLGGNICSLTTGCHHLLRHIECCNSAINFIFDRILTDKTAQIGRLFLFPYSHKSTLCSAIDYWFSEAPTAVIIANNPKLHQTRLIECNLV